MESDCVLGKVVKEVKVAGNVVLLLRSLYCRFIHSLLLLFVRLFIRCCYRSFVSSFVHCHYHLLLLSFIVVAVCCSCHSLSL